MKMKAVFLSLVMIFASAIIFAQEEALISPAAAMEDNSSIIPISAWRYLAAALAVGISCIAGGLAVGRIGTAAMGAMSENPELSGKALPYVGLAEGICLWGFLVALLILLL
jgi:V/A-type H+-transporting ATPase subunit K